MDRNIEMEEKTRNGTERSFERVFEPDNPGPAVGRPTGKRREKKDEKAAPSGREKNDGPRNRVRRPRSG